MSAEPGEPRARAEARLLADRGAAAISDDFFRSEQFLAAERVTHTLAVESGASTLAAPLLVREIPDDDGLDAISPYAYPGARTGGPSLDPAAIDLTATGLVSIFIRDRLGEPSLQGGIERSPVQVSDPELPRKSRMSDRQQIRKNEAAGYTPSVVSGPASTIEQRAAFAAVYADTMRAVEAGERYLFAAAYFDSLLASPLSWLFEVRGPDGEAAAAAIVVLSDGFLHYYLSGTADEHRRRAPSKNLITAVIDFAEARGAPLNLGGGMRPGDGLEEFKRGFANRQLPFRTHELICDPAAYRRLSGAARETDFFPAYRRVREPGQQIRGGPGASGSRGRRSEPDR